MQKIRLHDALFEKGCSVMGFDPEKLGATLTNGKLKHVATGLYKTGEHREQEKPARLAG